MSLTAQTSPSKDTHIHADMNQLMRGVLYPASNVVFSVQIDNPAEVKPVPGQDPSLATDPLKSTFGGWVAVENAALTLAESANLLVIPGRTCANGAPAPVTDPAWAAFVQQLRDAGVQAYKVAQAKDQEKMSDVAETVSEACAGCHRKWRDRRPRENRCK
jgi:hypothetical protein